MNVKKPTHKAALHAALAGGRNTVTAFKQALMANPRRFTNEELFVLADEIDQKLANIQVEYAMRKPQQHPAEFIQFVLCVDRRVTDFYFSCFPSLEREALPLMANGVLSSQAVPALMKHVKCSEELKARFCQSFPRIARDLNANQTFRVTCWSALIHRERQRSREDRQPDPDLLARLRAEAEHISASAPERPPRANSHARRAVRAQASREKTRQVRSHASAAFGPLSAGLTKRRPTGPPRRKGAGTA